MKWLFENFEALVYFFLNVHLLFFASSYFNDIFSKSYGSLLIKTSVCEKYF